MRLALEGSAGEEEEKGDGRLRPCDCGAVVPTKSATRRNNRNRLASIAPSRMALANTVTHSAGGKEVVVVGRSTQRRT